LACFSLVVLSAGALAVLALLLLQAWVTSRYGGRIYAQIGEVPPQRAALVFGAGYWPSGQLSDVLADRMDTAVALYEAGKVSKLLLSGDNRFLDYNEPQRMAEYAVTKGVPRADLVLDYAGRRTYDSCFRASAIFGVQDAILVSQAYHLPRALFTCERLGLEVAGVSADRRQYVYDRWYRLREVLALARAWIDVTVLHPLPVLGDPIPIQWEVPRVGSRDPTDG